MDEASTGLVQTASAQDHGALAVTLARAFEGDPVFAWMLPDPSDRLKRMVRLFKLLLRLHGEKGRILCNAENLCGSIWQPPGAAALPFATLAMHAPELVRVFGFNIMRSLAVSNAIERHFPSDRRFWYVHFVGVDPAKQHQGWGRAMMRQGLSFGEAEGLPTYLETARPENVAFYLGMGFEVLSEWSVAGGPHFWSLLREPAN
jgi:ribosomal protein S18 acetylase RimI-like enzyme